MTQINLFMKRKQAHRLGKQTYVYQGGSVSWSVMSDSFETPWTIARQASLSMEFSRQEYWKGLPCPLRADLPNPGIKPPSHMSLALAGRFFITSTTWEVPAGI